MSEPSPLSRDGVGGNRIAVVVCGPNCKKVSGLITSLDFIDILEYCQIYIAQ